jgi:hypothetical protein
MWGATGKEASHKFQSLCKSFSKRCKALAKQAPRSFRGRAEPVRSMQYGNVACALHVSFRLPPFYDFLSKRISKQTQMHERLLMCLS